MSTEPGRRMEGMIVVYDGECPFCANYVRLMALRSRTGGVRLVDARRDDSPAVRDLMRQGYDLNEGMAAIFGGRVYWGDDAVILISGLADGGGPLGRLLAWLLRDPRRARALYPHMKRGRRLVLRILGKPEIAPP